MSMNEKLRDNRDRGWYWINNEVIDNYRLTPYEMMVYNILCRHADDKGHSFPGISRMMELGSMSKPQVIRSIKRLEELGLLSVKRDEKPLEGETRQRGVNHYYLQNVKSGGVVSDIYYPSKPQTLGVVSDVDHNNTYSERDSEKGKSAPLSENQEVVIPAIGKGKKALPKTKPVKTTRTPEQISQDEIAQAWFDAVGGFGTAPTYYRKEAALLIEQGATAELVALMAAERNAGREDTYKLAWLVEDWPEWNAQRERRAREQKEIERQRRIADQERAWRREMLGGAV